MILTLQGGTQARTLLRMLAAGSSRPGADTAPATQGNQPSYATTGPSASTGTQYAEMSGSHTQNPNLPNTSFQSTARNPSSGAASTSCTASVKAGFLRGRSYPDGTPVAAIAAVQEFGAVIRKTTHRSGAVSIVIPPRPFMRAAMAQDAPKWKEVFRQALAESLAASHQPEATRRTLHMPTTALQRTGQAMQASITRAIQAVHTPPNSPATIHHKGSDKPLEDTKTLLNSVSFQVQS